VWTPISAWLEPVGRPLVEATGSQEALSTSLSVVLGLAGIGLAWWIYGARRMAAPRVRPVQALLEHKFYFDELYDIVFYRPAVLATRGLYALVERPLIAGSLTEIGAATRGVGGLARRLQTGLVRSYALAIAASLAVLVVVFVAAR
jgi:NADH-quinone oxidoreductase subunit L